MYSCTLVLPVTAQSRCVNSRQADSVGLQNNGLVPASGRFRQMLRLGLPLCPSCRGLDEAEHPQDLATMSSMALATSSGFVAFK